MDELAPATITPSAGYTRVFQPRITPEGDELFVRQSAPGLPLIASVLRRDGTTWVYDRDVPIASSFLLGTVSRAPGRRMVVFSATTGLVELDEANNWAQIGTYTAVDLGVESLYGISTLPNLSPDGTRLVFSGDKTGVETRSFYVSRASIADPFVGPAVPLAEVPRDPLAAFLTEDCSRVYFSALGVVFYLQQR
jgi:hypothetical protein